MTDPFPRPSLIDPEPLPDGFESTLDVVDAELGTQLRREHAAAPRGLADRVYQASAPGLRERALEVVGRVRRAERWWGRLAMAAALGLAAVLAATVLNRPAAGPGGGSSNSRTVALELDWLAYELDDGMAVEVDYLLETGGLGSLGQIAGDLESAFGTGAE